MRSEQTPGQWVAATRRTVVVRIVEGDGDRLFYSRQPQQSVVWSHKLLSTRRQTTVGAQSTRPTAMKQ